MEKLTRGDFVRLMVLFVGTGGAIATACSDSSSEPGPGDSNDPNGGGGSSSGGSSSGGSSSSSGGSSSGGSPSGDSGPRPNPRDANTPDSPQPTPSCSDNGARGNIGPGDSGSPHYHQNFIDVPASHFGDTTTTFTYELSEEFFHMHTFTLSPGEREQLKNGSTLTARTNRQGSPLHEHEITLTCA